MPSLSILQMFGRSPIRPLEQHMAKVHDCVKELIPFFEGVLQDDWATASRIQQDIIKFESDADRIKRDLRGHLPKGLFMPVSRSDLLELLSVQDRLANQAKNIVGLVLGRKITFPAQLIESYRDLLHCCVSASKQANVAIHELDELFETGFCGVEIKLVDNMIMQLSKIEKEADDKLMKINQTLLQQEENLPPLQVLFLYKLLEWTARLATQAQDIGDRLQILLAQ